MKKTVVKNLITKDEFLFVNDLSLTENIVNAIMVQKNQTGQILNTEARSKIKREHLIQESISTVTGKAFAFCEDFDFHAKTI